MAWQEWQDSLCSGCGNPRDETMDPKGPDYKATPIRCHACEERDIAARKWNDAGGDVAGLMFAVERIEEAPVG